MYDWKDHLPSLGESAANLNFVQKKFNSTEKCVTSLPTQTSKQKFGFSFFERGKTEKGERCKANEER